MNMPGDEQAKAVQETAKLGQQIAESGKKFFDAPLEQLGGWLGDYISTKRSIWYYKNMLNVFDRVEKINQRRVAEGRPIPIAARQSIPILEALAVEDDPTIQLLWAQLIANATDPAGPQMVKRAYVHILRSIDPVEARMLEFLRKKLKDADLSISGSEIPISELASSTKTSEEEALVALYHMTSLGCFRVLGSSAYVLAESSPVDPWPSISAPHSSFTVTSLAVSLLTACAPE